MKREIRNRSGETEMNRVAIVLLSVIASLFYASAKADVMTVNSLGISAVSDSLSAATTLSVSLSLVGAIVFILGMFVSKKRADTTESSAEWSKYDKRPAGSKRWTSISLHQVARGTRSGSND